MKIAIVGSGNIATFFGKKLRERYTIVQVISPTVANASQLAQQLNCSFATNISELNSDAGIVLFAVKDDVLRTLKPNESLASKVVIHTAGSVSLHDVDFISPNCGSIWCMYSINKNHLPQRNDIPLIVNASNENTMHIVNELSACISHVIYALNDEQKAVAHLSAVFANNFANHLFTIGQDILRQNNIPFDILIPLIQNTIEKLSYSSPDRLQTGPAIRHDEATIAKHLEILNNHAEFSNIYKMLTQSIQLRY
jgi:predicted short-subunit dehydrogenase-like oxidoreductase (DUF2520 family)